MGQTRDDAAGEAFDKVAKLLNLGYPGGGIIEDLALQGNPSIRFPRAIPSADSLDFSFSGIKTAVVNYVKGLPRHPPGKWVPLADIAASFQEAVVDMLINKVTQARQQYRTERLVLSGGWWPTGISAAGFSPWPGKKAGTCIFPFPFLYR